ncbi:BTB/POZ domain-containing protein 6-B-like [Nilaparvata lugens]|uniref:BTB/POZ domain-containing protein 6-B-like n=1 Tax=Nilaparvata lugens TaxID=108931 RepID=UPI00193D97BF|nr:BTB/POZ domain-containing protein 6-B-like [Nilaparvata lugens]
MSSTPESLKSKFELCLNNDDLSDCEFLVGEQKCKIKGHKLLFGISSPVFRAVLYDGLHNASTFEVKDVEPDVFQGMKQFIYTDSVNFSSGLQACSSYLASWKYVIPDLMSKCVQYIKDNISVSEVIDVYEFSCKYNIPDIEKICAAVFQNKTREVMQSEKFLSANVQTLETILKMDSLNLESELEVFKYTEKWAIAEAVRRNIDLQAEYFNCIKKHVRFLTMDKDQYKEGLSKSDLITAEERISLLHNLMDLEDELPHKFCPVSEPRNFTIGKIEEKQVREEEKKDRGYYFTRTGNSINCEEFRDSTVCLTFVYTMDKSRTIDVDDCSAKLFKVKPTVKLHSLRNSEDSGEEILNNEMVDIILCIENKYVILPYYLKLQLTEGILKLEISEMSEKAVHS